MYVIIMKILVVKPSVVTCLSESKRSPIFCSYMFWARCKLFPTVRGKKSARTVLGLFLRQGVLLCSRGWPGTLGNPASVTQVLGLLVGTLMSRSPTLSLLPQPLLREAETTASIAGCRSHQLFSRLVFMF